jgi:adenylate cyclase
MPGAAQGQGMSHEGGTPVIVGKSTGRRKIVRRLAAVLGADISGYSTLMAGNEEGTHRRVGSAMTRLAREIEKSYGRVFSFAGDGLMAEFPSAVEALKCALRVQVDASKRNVRLPREQHIEYRMGINSGEIVVQHERAGGTTVNIAARLEQIGEPGGIFISSTVFEQVNRIVATRYDLVGERQLKNIRQPIAVYRIAPEACQSWAGMPTLPRQTTPNTKTSGGDYRPSLAVLPLRTSPADMVDAYFAEGMVDDIIRLLGGLKELLVISRSSTLGFARAPLDLRRVGHELDVRYVLHGSVRRSSDRLRMAVELCEAESGEIIWADRFEGEFSDLFELQDRIAMRVATAIAPQLRERELSRAMRKQPATMTAYDLTLQALAQIYRMDRESFRQARKLLREAIAHDPHYAPAYSYSSYLQILIIGQGWSQDVEVDGALTIAAAEAAIRYDQNDAMALAVYGHIQSFVRKDYETAMTFLDRAIVAGPSCAWAWSMNSFTCQYRGDGGNAVTRAEHGVRLSPIGPDAFWHEAALSQAHYVNGNYDAAISWGRMSNAHSPNNGSNLRVLIASLVAIGEREQAARFAQQLLAIAPEFRLHVFRQRTPLEGELRDTFIERLRIAGLPG